MLISERKLDFTAENSKTETKSAQYLSAADKFSRR